MHNRVLTVRVGQQKHVRAGAVCAGHLIHDEAVPGNLTHNQADAVCVRDLIHNQAVAVCVRDLMHDRVTAVCIWQLMHDRAVAVRREPIMLLGGVGA